MAKQLPEAIQSEHPLASNHGHEPEQVLAGVRVLLKGRRLPVHDEIELQREIYSILKSTYPIEKEFVLDAKSRVDFFYNGLAIEVKVQGNKRSIFNQCKRYCMHEKVDALLLITTTSMGFPPEINGKPCYVLSLTSAWL